MTDCEDCSNLYFNNIITKSLQPINSDDRYFEGYLTVQVKDKQGEVTIVDELYKVLPIWMDRGAPISDTHSNRIIGKGINYSKSSFVDKDGSEYPAIKITGKIHKNYELDNEIWNKIKSGEYKGLSFGGATRTNREPIVMKDGSIAYALKELEHYEVAVCKDPAVPLALITDHNNVAKAIAEKTEDRGDGKMVIKCSKFGCYVKKDSLIKIEDEDDKNTKAEVLDEWKNDDNDHGEEKVEKADEDKPLNKPMRDDGDKKFKVYVKDPKTGNVVTVRFGDPNMEIKRDDPERRSSFRARHDCDNAKDITSAGYWSCKMWEKSSTVSDNVSKANWEVWLEKDNPCWKGYEQYGMKDKDGKQVPNCVKKADDEYVPEVTTEKERDEMFKQLKDYDKNRQSYEMYKAALKDQCLLTLVENIAKADLGKYDSFEGKVQALMNEGYAKENAENIVGSFVRGEKKAADGGDSGMLGADTEGANNTRYNKPIIEEEEVKKQFKEIEQEAGTDFSNAGGDKVKLHNQDSPGKEIDKTFSGGVRHSGKEYDTNQESTQVSEVKNEEENSGVDSHHNLYNQDEPTETGKDEKEMKKITGKTKSIKLDAAILVNKLRDL
jgi:hypothetical protein